MGVDVWVIHTRTDLRNRMGGSGLDSSGSGWWQVADGGFEHGKEPLNSTYHEQILD